MRTATCFDPKNAVLRERASLRQKLRIFLREDIVGDEGQAIPVAQLPTQASTSPGLPDPTGPPIPITGMCLVQAIVALSS
jgi:hypothetical protein